MKTLHILPLTLDLMTPKEIDTIVIEPKEFWS